MANPTDFPEETKLTESQLSSLGFKLRGKFTENEVLRGPQEQIWLEDTRMLNGIYDPDVLKRIGEIRSKAYPKVARSKAISVEARLHEITDPDIGKPWGISPSPNATIPPEAMQMVVDGLVKVEVEKWQAAKAQNEQAVLNGQPPVEIPPEPPMPSEAVVQEAFKKYAKQACKQMEIEIEDQFLDTKFPDKKKSALKSGLHLGTGVIKGPLVKFQEVKKWKPVNGTYVLDVQKVPRPYLEYVRLWDYYPDMTVSELDQCEGHFERHVMTKHDVRKLAKRDDFNGKVITEYLTANPDGDCVFKAWEIELQGISSEDSQPKKGRKYEVLEYWGYADAKDLAECGVIITEDLLDVELQVNVWILGDRVIKAVLNQIPKSEQPYHVFYFEKDETSIFGRGIPRIMRDSQINICAATRMMLDNAAITCLTGDTVVYRNQRSEYSDNDNNRPAAITLSELWENKHKHKSGLRRTKIRSVNEQTGEIFYNRILDVFDNGVASVFEIKTKKGYVIKATGNHRFLGDGGEWEILDNFDVGDMVAVNGQAVPLTHVCLDCGGETRGAGIRCRACAMKREHPRKTPRVCADCGKKHQAQ